MIFISRDSFKCKCWHLKQLKSFEDREETKMFFIDYTQASGLHDTCIIAHASSSIDSSTHLTVSIMAISSACSLTVVGICTASRTFLLVAIERSAASFAWSNCAVSADCKLLDSEGHKSESAVTSRSNETFKFDLRCCADSHCVLYGTGQSLPTICSSFWRLIHGSW